MNAVAVGAVTTNSGDRIGSQKKVVVVGFDALLQRSLNSSNMQERVGSKVKQNSALTIGSKARSKGKAEKAEDLAGLEELEGLEKFDKETFDRIEAVVMEQIARILNISVEELQSMMSELDYTIADLFTKEGMNTFIFHALGMDSENEALTNSEIIGTYKEVKDVIEEVLDDLNMEPQELNKLLVESVKSKESQEKVLVEPESKEAVELTITQKLEVLDERTTIEEDVVQVENTMKDDSLLNQKENSKQDSSNNSFEDLFTNVITQKFETVTAFGVEEVEVTVNAGEVMKQIVSQVKLAFTDESTTMFFQLQPENLGKVAFSVKTENGVLTGSFVAENLKIKEIIEMNLSNLKTNLEQQGIKLDEVKVVVGNTNQFFEKSDQENNHFHFAKSKKKKSRINKTDEGYQTILETTQVLRKTGLEEENNSIDYIA